jgi:hypothetical protein
MKRSDLVGRWKKGQSEGARRGGGGVKPESGYRTRNAGVGVQHSGHAVAVSRRTMVNRRSPVAVDRRQGERRGEDSTGRAALVVSSRSIRMAGRGRRYREGS